MIRSMKLVHHGRWFRVDPRSPAKFLVFAIMLPLMVGCGRSQPPTKGVSLSVSPARIQAIRDKDADFKETVTFLLLNKGDSHVDITKTAVDTEGVSVHVEPRRVEPGQQAAVKAQVDIKQTLNKRVHIRVFTDSSDQDVLTCVVDCEPREAVPGFFGNIDTLVFGGTKCVEGQLQFPITTVENTESDWLQGVQLASKQAPVQLKRLPERDKKLTGATRRAYQVSFRPAAGPGSYADKLQFFTKKGKLADVIGIEYRVPEAVQLTPAAIALHANAGDGNRLRRQVWVATADHTAELRLTVNDPTTLPSWVSASVNEKSPQKHQQVLQIELDPSSLQAGEHRCTVKLSSNISEARAIELPVQLTVQGPTEKTEGN